MKKNKINLKKVNKTNHSTVRVLACHCGCSGSALAAIADGYIGNYL